MTYPKTEIVGSPTPLKSCPFCGGVVHMEQETGEDGFHLVVCRNDLCGVTAVSAHPTAEETALEWNKRSN